MLNFAARLTQKGLMILALISAGSSAFGAKMDLDTHTVVIDRLEKILTGMEDDDSSKVPSSLRVADLLAERSRLKAMKEVEQNCSNCLKSVEDRRSAVRYYAYVIPKLDGLQRSQAMIQKAHLHYALNELAPTEQLYKQITVEGNRRHTLTILGQAHASLGDVYFQKGKFKEAKAQYEKALAINDTPQKGIVHFRLAWCLFNLNQTQSAIAKMEMILQTPKLTETINHDGVAAQDESFKIDVSKDLASFYSRSTITRATITRLTSLSPESQKQSNIYTLATEADRVGKKREAALVWMVYLENNPQEREALEPQIRLMKLKRDMGEAKAALVTFNHVGDLWKKPGCGKDASVCENLNNQIRQWITDWNREEKKIQTQELTQAYLIYAEIFPADDEMLFRGAGVAQQRNQLRQAFELYRRAAAVAHHNLAKGNDLAPEKRTLLLKTFDAALIGEIDMSETIKDHELRLKAYNHYLELNPKGPREFEVRYQIAQTEFEKKNYPKSAELFRSLALENNPNGQNLHKTAAHMSIESLIKIKNEEAIEKVSIEFMKRFPKNLNEFALIHRKAVLNLVAVRINQKKADSSDLTKLYSVSLAGATSQERISLYKSRYMLALRLEKFPEAKQANQDLLALKDLNAGDREEAWTNRIWLAELELDFRVAYHLTESHAKRMNAETALRLIWLAEMAGVNPEKHENDFLRLSGNRALRATVISNRIQRQKNPDRELKKFASELSKSPETLARLSLEVYGRTKNQNVLKDAYSFSSVRRTPTGPIINRLLQYKDLNSQIAKLSSARLNSRSEKGLKQTLETRIQMLKGLEREGQRAIANRDPVMQAIILNTLRFENERLAKDIMSLPIPRGLKPEQKEQYQALVAEQAQPYAIKASQFEKKALQLWDAKNNWSEQLAQNYLNARQEYKPALRQDLDQLSRHAPAEYRQNLLLALSKPVDTPTEKVVSKVRQQIKQNPFEEGYVTELRDLENRRGNDIVVAHLDARLHQMRGTLK